MDLRRHHKYRGKLYFSRDRWVGHTRNQLAASYCPPVLETLSDSLEEEEGVWQHTGRGVPDSGCVPTSGASGTRLCHTGRPTRQTWLGTEGTVRACRPWRGLL